MDSGVSLLDCLFYSLLQGRSIFQRSWDFLWVDIPAVRRDLLQHDSTECLRSDLDTLLGDSSSSLGVDRWSLGHDSSVLSHLTPPSESVSDPPWITYHLSRRRDHFPSFCAPWRLLGRFTFLCALPSSVT
jgi:hypothetical protein